MGLQEEIKELEQRFAEAPDSRLFLPLADALRRAGELERAVKLCREGLQRFPDFSSASILLGQALAEMDELEEASRVLEGVVGADSGNRRLMKELAAIAEKRGDEAEVQKWTRLASAENDAPEAGRVKAAAEEAQEAVLPDAPDVTDEIEEPAEEPEPQPDVDTGELNAEAGAMFVTHTLGDIYRMQGHDSKALEVYRRLLDEGHDDPELKRKIGELTQKLGESPQQETPQVDPSPEPKIAPEAEKEKEAVSSGEPVNAPVDEAGGRFEQRVNAIFHFLLGDSPEQTEIDTAGQQEDQPFESHPKGKKATAAAGSGDFVEMLDDWIDDLKQGM